MADLRTLPGNRGFSMVEMMVALVFTMFLMAGMASVFRASLMTSYTSGEILSSVRRNRMSIDLLGTDLDTACMYLGDLSDPPAIDSSHPPFYILPNMVITGDPSANKADQLYFQVDQPLPFQGKLQPGGGANSAATVVNNGGTLAANNGDNTFVINCANSPTYANMVAQGQTVIFEDNFDSGTILSAPTVSGSSVTVVLGASSTSSVTGSGSTGLPMKEGHIVNSNVVFATLGQVIRYQLQYLLIDPTNVNGVPCLVRDQGTFVGGVFTPGANNPQQIIAENVTGFKVYLSVNAGQGWAGWAEVPQTYTDMTGWNGDQPTGSAPSPGSILYELNAQLGTEVTNGFTAISGNPNWFRSIPTAVRVDITSRTAMQRTEYATNPGTSTTPTYKTLTQSLIFMPRHSGLPLD